MNTPDPEQIIELQATAVTRDELNWIEYQDREKQETLKRYEETAKYLSGLSTITLTILAGPNNDSFKFISQLFLLKTGIVCWLASIVCTLAVLFPFRYTYIKNSARSIKEKYAKTARVKYVLLFLGTLFYLVGVIITVYLYLFK
jgi:hypothetical protein